MIIIKKPSSFLIFFYLLTCVQTTVCQKAPYPLNFSSLPKNVRAEHISQEPYILCLHNFITDAEAEFLKKVAQPLFKQSLVVGKENFHVANPGRTSQSAFLYTIRSQIITAISKRAATFLNSTVKDVEGLQVVYYKNHQRYDPHYDYFDRTTATGKASIGTQGQRMATFLVYLNDIKPCIGGETFFPKVGKGLTITPKKNMAVFWFNVLPSGTEDQKTLHAGLPIKPPHEKYAMNIWVRNPKLT